MFRKIVEYFLGAHGPTFVGCTVGGWIISLHLLLHGVGPWSFLSIEFFVKTIVGLAISVITGMVGVVGKEAGKELWAALKRWYKNRSRSKK